MERYICIHGHFYQPPRENPWLEEIELQDPAYPYHDWNERITAECYAPNSASRILDANKKIIDIVNNYKKMSFNFGPTLLSWMKKHTPDLYQAILAADRESQKEFPGHGSAIAQPYNHIIMPLANRRDKETQVRWGIKDFEQDFQRKPEGMWLPELAVDLETLEIMAGEGIKFTILAPHQALRVRKIGERKWEDVRGEKIDPKIPYHCKLPSGRAINLFFYDAEISKDVAFRGLLNNGEIFANRLVNAFTGQAKFPQIVHIATDGETYGHHHRFGDMALAYCFHYLESKKLARITVYGEYLEKFPPTHEVEIVENTSWSCFHGVDRWKGNCGCNSGRYPGWAQEWRKPLREAMDWLRDSLIGLYEEEMARYVKDPWGARDDYIEVIHNRSPDNVEQFFSRHALRELSHVEKVKALQLLEMQLHSMLMYTSCGWFFDDISGIETVQVMMYAARAMQLARAVKEVDLEPVYLKMLEKAPSNIPEFKDGAQVYELFVRPAVVDLLRVGAHYAVSSLFEDYQKTTEIYCYTANSEKYEREVAGKHKLAIGKTCIRSQITWEEACICFAVLYFGGHNLIGSVGECVSDEPFNQMQEEVKNAFLKGNIPKVIRLMDKHYGTHSYSLWHLFKDKQREILDQIMEDELKEIENLFRQIYEHDYPVMTLMKEMQVPLPKAFSTVVEFILNMDLRRLLEAEEINLRELQKLVEEIKRWAFELDKTTLNFVASQKINSLMERLADRPEDIALMGTLEAKLRILSALPLELNLWRAQNIHFSIGKQLYNAMKEKANTEIAAAKEWLEHFNNLGTQLHMSSK